MWTCVAESSPLTEAISDIRLVIFYTMNYILVLTSGAKSFIDRKTQNTMFGEVKKIANKICKKLAQKNSFQSSPLKKNSTAKMIVYLRIDRGGGEGISKKTETNAHIRNGSTDAQKNRCRVLGTLILCQYTEFHREWCKWMRIVIVCVKPVDEKYAVK